jgi:dipeptidyl aminopeptidase/acylaminoacyl peptidase
MDDPMTRWTRRVWSLVVLLLVAPTLAACALVVEQNPTPEPTVTPSPAPTATPELTATPISTPIPTPTHEPSPTPTPYPSPTPEPTPVPTPELVNRVVSESPCCGLFDWAGDERLLLFDRVEGSPDGLWVVDVGSGERQFVAPGFGIVSDSGRIAFVDPDGRSVSVRTLDGNETARVDTSGMPAWPSSDGTRLAWLERLPVRTPSSSVNRSVRLNVADLDAGSVRQVLELQAAEVHWLPDSRRLVIPARDLSFERAGIWLIDVETGDAEIVIEELFIQTVRPSPDGERVAFMRTFNDNPEANGIWVLDLQSRAMTRVAEQGSFRWDPDGGHLWILNLALESDEPDRLRRVEIGSGENVSEHVLSGRVLQSTWEVSPGGDFVAYWREPDRHVQIEELVR